METAETYVRKSLLSRLGEKKQNAFVIATRLHNDIMNTNFERHTSREPRLEKATCARNGRRAAHARLTSRGMTSAAKFSRVSEGRGGGDIGRSVGAGGGGRGWPIDDSRTVGGQGRRAGGCRGVVHVCAGARKCVWLLWRGRGGAVAGVRGAAAVGAAGADRGAAGAVWPECVSRLASPVGVARYTLQVYDTAVAAASR